MMLSVHAKLHLVTLVGDWFVPMDQRHASFILHASMDYWMQTCCDLFKIKNLFVLPADYLSLCVMVYK